MNGYRTTQLKLLKDRYGEDGVTFNIGMIHASGLFYEVDLGRDDKAYKAELKTRRGPSLAVIANDIADVLANADGFRLPLGDGTPDKSKSGGAAFGKTLLSNCKLMKPGYTKERLIDAIKSDKSLDKYRDENGNVIVELKPRKPSNAGGRILPEDCPTVAVPRELDEQDQLNLSD